MSSSIGGDQVGCRRGVPMKVDGMCGGYDHFKFVALDSLGAFVDFACTRRD